MRLSSRRIVKTLECSLKFSPVPTRLAGAVLALLSVSGASFAQEVPVPAGTDSAARTNSTNRLDRVEISARQQTDTELRRKSQVAKQTYGREEIDKFGDTNVADVLKRLPGINVASGAPRMRGLGSGYTLILINGDPAPPGFALDQLDPAQVERIEVTKGPTADQSAQAVAGAINIILKDAPRVSQRDLRLGMGYSAVRPGVNGTFTFGEKVGQLAYSVPISVMEWRGLNESTVKRYTTGSDGLDSLAIQHTEQDNLGHGINSAPRLNWRLNDDQTLTLQSFLQKGHWKNITPYDNQILQGSPTLDDDVRTIGTWQMVRGNLQWVNRFSDTQRVELKGGLQDAKGSSDAWTYHDGSPLRHTVGDNHDRNFTQGGKYAQLLNDEHSLTVGWDLEWRRRDETKDVTENGVAQLPDYDGQPYAARIQRQALFIQDEWELNSQWSTYLGVRGERITTNSSGSTDVVDNRSSVLTPLWHLNYKFDPKGRDMIRSSLTRSYKAPDLASLMARPSLSTTYPDASKPNSELSPDHEGNPLLKPELATGLDVSYEKYLSGGGMISVGGFYRKVNNLIRSVTTLESPSWAAVPRYVSRPVNFSKAQTGGLELEVKGRAGELMPEFFDAKLPLNLRAALSFYRSRVDVLEGPNNRLDGQQPWSGSFGFDYRFAGLPLTTGASLTYTPGYSTQQTETQRLDQSRARSLDVFAQLMLDRTTSLRLSANNISPLDSQSNTVLASGYYTSTEKVARTWFGANVEMKF